jgi:hypothetical protein
MPDRTVQIRLTRCEVETRLPPLLIPAARSAGRHDDVFLPSGDLVATRAFDVSPAARGSADATTPQTHTAGPTALGGLISKIAHAARRSALPNRRPPDRARAAPATRPHAAKRSPLPAGGEPAEGAAEARGEEGGHRAAGTKARHHACEARQAPMTRARTSRPGR